MLQFQTKLLLLIRIFCFKFLVKHEFLSSVLDLRSYVRIPSVSYQLTSFFSIGGASEEGAKAVRRLSFILSPVLAFFLFLAHLIVEVSLAWNKLNFGNNLAVLVEISREL